MIRARFLAATMWLGVLLAVAPFANAATTYTFVQFDVPSAPNTNAFGINDQGQIVGIFAAIGFPTPHGFLRDTNGSFTTIDWPGLPSGCFTWASGINNAGEIVGFFGNRSPPCSRPEHGFLFTPLGHDNGGSFTQIDVSDAVETNAYGINNRGQITGGFTVLNHGHGFVDTDGSFTAFDVPGALHTGGTGINDAGLIVGIFVALPGILGNPVPHGFLRDTNGTFTTIDMPGQLQAAGRGGEHGINNAGQIVGSFYPGVGPCPPDCRLGPEHGFVRYTNGTFIQLDVPGAMQTGAAGINNAGQIVGVSVSSDFLQHGFVATPVFRGTPGQTNCYGKSVSRSHDVLWVAIDSASK